MAPKVPYIEVFETPVKDNEVGGSSVTCGGEKSSIFVQKMAVAGPGKGPIPPNNNVRELLECPVCMSAMYPPIHQVLTMIFIPMNGPFPDVYDA